MANTVNAQMFFTLKVSELSGVPTLFVSNPGVGKSSTVEIFADIRGYHLLTLRGNSTTADEIMGYDTVPEGVKEGTHRAAVGLRPSWFQELMDVHEKGGKTLLFLDEITTANEFVQAALLHLVFERACKDEKLPDDTLIVAAGNYAQNLSSSMQLLAPMMNRFAIVNLVPKAMDVDAFLNFYKGAAASATGTSNDKMAELRRMLEDMDKEEIEIPEALKYRVGEYFESAIAITAKMLINSKRCIDWNVTDLSTIYSDSTDSNSNLYGFVTLRTLTYLVRWTCATYRCFGAPGIKSDNFKNSIDGLCGIGVTRDSSCQEVKVNHVTDDFRKAIVSSLRDIEKLSNAAVPEYEEFFKSVINGKAAFSNSDLVAVSSKINAMLKDKRLKNIERPIDPTFVSSFCTAAVGSANAIKKALSVVSGTTHTAEELNACITPEQLSGLIAEWNQIVDTTNLLSSVIADPNNNYEGKEKTTLRTMIDTTTQNVGLKIQSVKRLMVALNKGVVVTDIHLLKSFNA